MKSRISSKGQVTVPVEVRERLGLRRGTVVEFALREGGVILRKGAGETHPVDVVYGKVRLDAPVDRLKDEMRGREVGPRADEKKKR